MIIFQAEIFKALGHSIFLHLTVLSGTYMCFSQNQQTLYYFFAYTYTFCGNQQNIVRKWPLHSVNMTVSMFHMTSVLLNVLRITTDKIKQTQL